MITGWKMQKTDKLTAIGKILGNLNIGKIVNEVILYTKM